ncbi:hypothetical protein NMY22_g5174 [Coprinellus aureogranulatus]|nr:hypothetical protein NMY22_g5174 [Coprinellus aureogranulatus]
MWIYYHRSSNNRTPSESGYSKPSTPFDGAFEGRLPERDSERKLESKCESSLNDMQCISPSPQFAQSRFYASIRSVASSIATSASPHHNAYRDRLKWKTRKVDKIGSMSVPKSSPSR